MAIHKQVLALANGVETNDVIEDWRHWLALSLVMVGHRVLFISPWESLWLCIFQWLSNILCTEIQFWQVYTSLVGNLLHRVSRQIIQCAVLLESFKNFTTLIRKRRTLWETFYLGEVM